MDIREMQKRIDEMFGDEDRISGSNLLTSVLLEEAGELASATRGKGDVAEEAADVLFITLSIANLHKADVLSKVEEKYLKRSKEEIASSWRDVEWKS